MYKCKVIHSKEITKRKQNSQKLSNRCCGKIVLLSSESSLVIASIRIRKKRRTRARTNNTFVRCETLPSSGSFWQRHNQNLTLTHKTHRSIVKPYRYIVVV